MSSKLAYSTVQRDRHKSSGQTASCVQIATPNHSLQLFVAVTLIWTSVIYHCCGHALILLAGARRQCACVRPDAVSGKTRARCHCFHRCFVFCRRRLQTDAFAWDQATVWPRVNEALSAIRARMQSKSPVYVTQATTGLPTARRLL